MQACRPLPLENTHHRDRSLEVYGPHVGAMVRVACRQGDLEVDATVGCGMAGTTICLCACSSCRGLVEIVSELGEPEVRDGAACPRCGTATTVVADGDDDHPQGP